MKYFVNSLISYILIVLLFLYIIDSRREIKNLKIELMKLNDNIEKQSDKFEYEMSSFEDYVDHRVEIMDDIVTSYTKGMKKDW